MIVRLEGISSAEAAVVAGGRSLREILHLARRIADQLDMSADQRRGHEIIFADKKPRRLGVEDDSPAYAKGYRRVVFQCLYWRTSTVGDFEAVLVEELQHSLDRYQGIRRGDDWPGTPYYAKNILEFHAIIQMARLRPVPTVYWSFRKAVEAVISEHRLSWCLNIDPEHLRQAVVNAELPRELVRSLAQNLRVCALDTHAWALEELLEEELGDTPVVAYG